jgi:glycosyltransferase involved in cell wall biosynthesis
MKILWASPNTILDTANGAGLAVREILKQLKTRGCDVKILGGTVFVNPAGTKYFHGILPQIMEKSGSFLEFKDDQLVHELFITQRVQRRLMLSYEEKMWFDRYCKILEEFSPDLVMFFDNSLITMVTASEAKHYNIPAVVYLAHPYNQGKRWCRDVSLMLTDTEATAKFYKKRENYDLVSVGTFIKPESYKAEKHSRETILFVNPSLAKGAVFVIQLALSLEKNNPEIKIEILDSKNSWDHSVKTVAHKLGKSEIKLSNVRISPNTSDMKSVYSRTKILLVPSVWWDSGPRVIVEAMLNGIPVIGSNSGGIAENIGQGGFVFKYPKIHFEPPYDKLVDNKLIDEVKGWIVKMYDDEEFYNKCVQNAYQAHEILHNIEENTDKLLQILNQVVGKENLVKGI